MTPKAILDRAGAGQGSVYHHFTGKADLAAAAIEGMAMSFREGADRWLSKPGTPLQTINGSASVTRAAEGGARSEA